MPSSRIVKPGLEPEALLVQKPSRRPSPGDSRRARNLVRLRALAVSLTILDAVAVSLHAAQSAEKTPPSQQFRLEQAEEEFSLRVQSSGRTSRIRIPREWLIPPQEEKAEEDDYISSFAYNEEVGSFPIGNGEVGIHLSSYAIAQEGSAGAAAGRDVFLVLEPDSRQLRPGPLQLGVTEERVRSEGCWRAKAAHFLLADVNDDGLGDIGVVREQIDCSSYFQYPPGWYVFSAGTWKLDSAYARTWPEKWSELPLLGMKMTPVDFVGNARWHTYDPARWGSGVARRPPPRFVPEYRKVLIRSSAGQSER
jgi:hypothetical protein